MKVRKPIRGVLMDGLWVTEAHFEEPYRIQLRISPQRNGKAGNIFLPIVYLFGWGVFSACWIPALNFNWKSYPRTKESPQAEKRKIKSRCLQWVLSENMQTVQWGYKCTWKGSERTEGRADTESAAQFLFLKVQSFNCCSLVPHLTTAPILLESHFLQKQLFGSKQAHIVEDILPCISYL